jgi:hypothetical protein
MFSQAADSPSIRITSVVPRSRRSRWTRTKSKFGVKNYKPLLALFLYTKGEGRAELSSRRK